MIEKGLAVDDEGGEEVGEPVYMPSVADESRRIAAWLGERFGPVEFVHRSFHHLRCTVPGGAAPLGDGVRTKKVTIQALLWGDSRTVEWLIGYGVRRSRAGGTAFGANLDDTAPASITMAADFAKVQGGAF